MPRKRPKTPADRTTYRGPKLVPVPDELEPYLAAMELGRIVDRLFWGLQGMLEARRVIAVNWRST
jgi:hypothetical protein